PVILRTDPARVRADVLRGKPEQLEQLAGRRRLAEAVDADHASALADEAMPRRADAGFDCDARNPVRQHELAIVGGLGIESLQRRHGYDAQLYALCGPQPARLRRQRDFGPGCDRDGVGPAILRIGEYVAAECNHLNLIRRTR